MIGESTDEPVNDYGNPLIFYLPKSRLPFIVPSASFYSPTRPENDKSKVIPDIEVKPDRNTLIKGEDAALNKAIEWINQ